MYAIELAGPDLGQFRRVDRPDPSPPGPGRVLVRMKAASINFMDLAVATGQYPGVTYPIVPLVDGAGEVIQIGPDVWQVAVGDRVAVHSKPRWIAGKGNATIAKSTRGVNMPGSLIEIADLDAATILKMPDHLSWEGIAATPGAGVAAWLGLEAASVGPASTVVLLGTGGVSIFALQLAKVRGARIIITSSSDQKLQRARALGADETANYRDRPEWDAVVRSLTGGPRHRSRRRRRFQPLYQGSSLWRDNIRPRLPRGHKGGGGPAVGDFERSPYRGNQRRFRGRPRRRRDHHRGSPHRARRRSQLCACRPG